MFYNVQVRTHKIDNNDRYQSINSGLLYTLAKFNESCNYPSASPHFFCSAIPSPTSNSVPRFTFAKTWESPLGRYTCSFLPSLWRVELMDTKVLPCCLPVHELARHFSFRIPPAHIQIYHTNPVALFCSRGKLVCRSRRGVSRQSDFGQMLKQGAIARPGTPIKCNGRDVDVCKECGKRGVDGVPLFARDPDETES